MKRTTTTLFTFFLRALGVPHTKRYSDRRYREHPHRSNLYGFTSLLAEYGVKTLAIRVEDKKSTLKQLPIPFVAEAGGDLVVVEGTEQRTDGKWIVYTSSEKQYTQPEESFLLNWSGVALLAEKTAESAEPDLARHRADRRIETAALLTALLSVAGFLALFASKSGFESVIGRSVPFLLLSALGVYLSVLLLRTRYARSRQAERICTMFGKHDCKEILDDAGSELLGRFGWAEIGLGFFAANLLAALLLMPEASFVLGAVNTLALAYSVWSIWYQKFVIRRWCVLCLLVQGVVLLLFLNTLLFGYFGSPVPDLATIAGVLFLYAGCTIGCALLIPVLAAGSECERVRCDLRSFKSNESVFASLLFREKSFRHVADDSALVFGNPEGKIAVTVLSNPHCHPCAQMHEKISRIAARNGNIRIRYVLTSFGGEMVRSAEFLVAVYLEYGREKAARIYDEWFAGGSKFPDEFFARYPLDTDSERVRTEMAKHKRWRDETGFRATPTVLVAGYLLPVAYTVDDLELMSELNV